MYCFVPQPLHGIDHLSTTMSCASPLDETLDKEVLLMLQGPSPEHMALEFKTLLNKLVRECDCVCAIIQVVKLFIMCLKCVSIMVCLIHMVTFEKLNGLAFPLSSPFHC